MSDGPATTRSHGVRHLSAEAAVGQRIDNFLLALMPGVPRARIYRMLRKGEVRVNGSRVRPTYRLHATDVVRVPPVTLPPREAPAALGSAQRAALEQAILYSDDELLVINKPSGLAVHGGSGVELGVIEALRQLYPGQQLALGHRIDRDTSGCLVLARSRDALVRVHQAFREGRVRKTYDVVVGGRWPGKLRSVRLPLRRYTTRTGERRVRVDAAGKPARTEFQVRDATASASWLVAHPHTGRTHQIRVHCRAEGHAVVGDEKYADDHALAAWRSAGVTRLCLHARRLVIPWTDGDRRFEAPVDDEFVGCWHAVKGLHS